MPQALVESPQSTHFGGGSEAAQFRIERLERKMNEMKARAAEVGGLSDANIDHYNFISLHKQFEEQKLRTGDDIHLVLRPIGVLRKPGEVIQARIVCVLPERAAEIMAFAPKRNQAARPATAEEIKAYKDYNTKQTQRHQGRVAAEQARIAQASLQAILGQVMPAASTPALPQDEAPPEPTAPLATPQPGDGLEGQVSPEGGPVMSQSPKPQPGDTQRAGGFEADMQRLGNDKQVSPLLEAGYFRVDQVAEASPADLTKIKGIGPKTASELIVRASQIRAERETKAEEAALQREADNGARDGAKEK